MQSLVLVVKSEKFGYIMPQQTIKYFEHLDQHKKVCVVAIGGKVKSGKSYLLNRLFSINSRSRFEINSSISRCTRGINLINIPMPDMPNHQIFVLDTQGFGGVEDTQNNYEYQILSILLSSFYIFNSVGTLDENNINTLGFLLKLADNSEVGLELPEFLWVLRDFNLRVKDREGNDITENQYLEKALKYQTGDSEIIKSKNNLRKVFKTLFPSRSLVTLPRPVIEEKYLQNIEKLSEFEIRPQFQLKLNEIRQYILSNLRQKKVKGLSLTPIDFCNLCQQYFKTLNQGGIEIHNANYYIEKIEIKRIKNEIIKEISARPVPQENRMKLTEWAITELKRRNVFGEDKETLRQLEKQIQEIYMGWDFRSSPIANGSHSRTEMIQSKYQTNKPKDQTQDFSKFQFKDKNTVMNKLKNFNKNTDSQKKIRLTQIVSLLIDQMQQSQRTKQQQMMNYKSNIAERFEQLESVEKTEHMMKLQIAFLESQNSFLKSQNKQKQTIINNLLMIPSNDFEQKYNELLVINRNLTQALKNSENKSVSQDNNSKSKPTKILIQINKTVVKYDNYKKPYIQYQIQIRRGNITSIVNRRYKSFIQMHNILEQIFPQLSLSDSPFEVYSNSKAFKIGKEGTNVQERCRDLERYLNTLLNFQEIANCQIFRKFLELDEEAKVKKDNNKWTVYQSPRVVSPFSLAPSSQSKSVKRLHHFSNQGF